jgi:hypothetical protein
MKLQKFFCLQITDARQLFSLSKNLMYKSALPTITHCEASALDLIVC